MDRPERRPIGTWCNLFRAARTRCFTNSETRVIYDLLALTQVASGRKAV